jgi:hypothetical protein
MSLFDDIRRGHQSLDRHHVYNGDQVAAMLYHDFTIKKQGRRIEWYVLKFDFLTGSVMQLGNYRSKKKC